MSTCLRSLQALFYPVLAVICCGAWAGSTGYAPTGRQIIDGAFQDVRSLLGGRSALSWALSAFTAAAALTGAASVLRPMQWFQPADFT